MEKTIFISLTIAAIISQVPHVWYTILSFSRLTGWIKQLQAIVFCSILSVAIFGFVWIGETELALFGAIIEVIINMYYYSQEIWQRKQDSRDKKQRRKDIRRFWRNNWIAMFMGLLFPALIYIFSHILLENIS